MNFVLLDKISTLPRPYDEARAAGDLENWRSAAEKAGLKAGWRVVSISVAADRPAKEWAIIPALLLLGGIGALQRRRQAPGG